MFDHQEFYELAQHHPDTRLRQLVLPIRKYLLRTLLVLGTLLQWFLLWKLWIGKPLPEILGEINGLAPPCESISVHNLPIHMSHYAADS
jgi:hypothetical protein